MCDTLVALKNLTKNGPVIFGKNCLCNICYKATVKSVVIIVNQGA
ncbi:hypothetical protein [Caloramator sp.]|nr:hypothetical protein [Caloramator sp.]